MLIRSKTMASFQLTTVNFWLSENCWQKLFFLSKFLVQSAKTGLKSFFYFVEIQKQKFCQIIIVEILLGGLRLLWILS